MADNRKFGKINKILLLLNQRKEYLIFIIARVISVLVKPSLLGLFIYFGLEESATQVSLFFLALSSLMVVLNNESHFYFYKVKFSEDASPLTVLREEVKYYEGLVLHSLIFSILVGVLTFLLVDLWWLSIIVFVLILLEKVFDEIQRYLQFVQNFIAWSKLMLVRQLVPFFVTLIVLVLSTDVFLVTGAYFLTTFFIFLYQGIEYTTKRQRNIISQFIRRLGFSDIKDYFSYYRKKLVWNQIQSFSTRNVPLLDRIIVRFIEKDFLAVMSVISQMGSLCILFVDYFLISHRRKEYLRQGWAIFDIASPLKVVFFWAAALLIFAGTVGCLYATGMVVEINTYWRELILVGVYYSVYAISQHFVNYNFWNRVRAYTLSIDILYYLLCCVIFYLLMPDTLSLLFRISGTLIIGHIFRLVLQVGLAFTTNMKKGAKG